jgi:hypothetical protein
MTCLLSDCLCTAESLWTDSPSYDLFVVGQMRRAFNPVFAALTRQLLLLFCAPDSLTVQALCLHAVVTCTFMINTDWWLSHRAYRIQSDVYVLLT